MHHWKGPSQERDCADSQASQYCPPPMRQETGESDDTQHPACCMSQNVIFSLSLYYSWLFFLKEIAFFCHLFCCNWIFFRLILLRDWSNLKCSASLISTVDWKKNNKSAFVPGLMKFYFFVHFYRTCSLVDCLSSHEVFGYFTFHHDIQHYFWPGSTIPLPLLSLLCVSEDLVHLLFPLWRSSLSPLPLLLLLGATSPASCTQQNLQSCYRLCPLTSWKYFLNAHTYFVTFFWP